MDKYFTRLYIRFQIGFAAPYMVKAVGGAKSLCPQMIHATCLEHGLRRAAEFVRSIFPKVNRLIATEKKIFVEDPHKELNDVKTCAQKFHFHHLQ